MRGHRLCSLVFALIVAAFTVTCARITVNAYFPAAKIQDAATQIENEARSNERTPSDQSPANSSFQPKQKESRFWPH